MGFITGGPGYGGSFCLMEGGGSADVIFSN